MGNPGRRPCSALYVLAMGPGPYEVIEGAVWSLWSHRRRRLLSIVEGAGFSLVDEYARSPLFADSKGNHVELNAVLDVIRIRYPHLVYDLYQSYMDLSRTGEPER